MKKTTLLLALTTLACHLNIARAQEPPRQVVINEIHSDPTNSKSFPTEFIELYNPLPEAVNLSGWAFTRGISYTFSPGTTQIGRAHV